VVDIVPQRSEFFVGQPKIVILQHRSVLWIARPIQIGAKLTQCM
jgi:hypothetical protein